MQKECDELTILERNIINHYNEILKGMLQEGDMEALEQVVTDAEYREQLMSNYTGKLKMQYGIYN